MLNTSYHKESKIACAFHVHVLEERKKGSDLRLARTLSGSRKSVIEYTEKASMLYDAEELMLLDKDLQKIVHIQNALM